MLGKSDLNLPNESIILPSIPGKSKIVGPCFLCVCMFVAWPCNHGNIELAVPYKNCLAKNLPNWVFLAQ